MEFEQGNFEGMQSLLPVLAMLFQQALETGREAMVEILAKNPDNGIEAVEVIVRPITDPTRLQALHLSQKEHNSGRQLQ